jgi:trehalose/maltose transport system substrate-binding protein
VDLVKHRALLVLAGTIAVLALVVSLTIASAGTERKTTPQAATAIALAAVPNAKSIKSKYGGQTITFVGDSVGGGHQRDTALAKKFSQQTGIKVKVTPHPAASDASYSQLARAFSTHSSSIDVAMIDAVWPGAFASFLVDLKAKLGQQAKIHSQGIIQNDTVKEARRDAVVRRLRDALLPHRPAEEVRLQKAAGVVDPAVPDGEEDPGRRAGTNPNFGGFVFQGNAYEGLTCDALEWIASSAAATSSTVARRRSTTRRPPTSSTCSVPISA